MLRVEIVASKYGLPAGLASEDLLDNVQRAAEDINGAFHKHLLVLAPDQPDDDSAPIYEVMPLRRRHATAATHIDLLPASATSAVELSFFTRMFWGPPPFEFQVQYAAFVEYRNLGSVGKLPKTLLCLRPLCRSLRLSGVS